jgi:outer membrane protein assembly factor BamA
MAREEDACRKIAAGPERLRLVTTKTVNWARRRAVAVISRAALVGLGLSACVREAFPPDQFVVAEVAIAGVESERRDDLLAGLATVESPKFLGLWDGVAFEYEVFDEELLRRDLERVERYLASVGYYEARVTAARVVRLDQHRVRVEIAVVEGEPVRTGSIELSGLEFLPLAVGAEAVGQMPLSTGEVFVEADYEKTKSHVLRTLHNAGYAFATVKGAVQVDVANRSVNVELRVDMGDVFRKCINQVANPQDPACWATLGPISFEGLRYLKEEDVRDNLGLSSGERYSQADLDDAARALLSLGVFSSVRIKPRLTGASDNVVPVVVEVEETRLRGVRVGLGGKLDPLQLSTHLSIGWEDRDFFYGLRHLSIDNQPGLIYFPTRFDLNALQAPNRALFTNKLRATLEQPAFIEDRTTGTVGFDFNLYPVLYTQTEAESPVLGFGELRARTGVERAFFEHRIRLGLTFNWQLELPVDYSELSFGKKVNANDALLDPLLIAYPELQASLDLRDNPLEPHAGAFFSLNLQSSLPQVGSDAQDVRVRPEVRLYAPISSRVTFATRALTGFLFSDEYGAIDGDADAVDERELARTQMKLLFRGFFSGGSTSNRGYSLGAVGPSGNVLFLLPSQDFCDDSPQARQCNQPLGGRSLWETSAEVRVQVLESLVLALFMDGSNVQPNVEFTFPGYWSWGAGIRYRTPIGPLRLDVGIPFEYPRDTSGVALFAMHLTLGEAF